MSPSLIKVVQTTAENLLQQVARNRAVETSSFEDVDSYPSKRFGCVETEEEGELYYCFEVRRQPFDDELETELNSLSEEGENR